MTLLRRLIVVISCLVLLGVLIPWLRSLEGERLIAQYGGWGQELWEPLKKICEEEKKGEWKEGKEGETPSCTCKYGDKITNWSEKSDTCEPYNCRREGGYWSLKLGGKGECISLYQKPEEPPPPAQGDIIRQRDDVFPEVAKTCKDLGLKPCSKSPSGKECLGYGIDCNEGPCCEWRPGGAIATQGSPCCAQYHCVKSLLSGDPICGQCDTEADCAGQPALHPQGVNYASCTPMSKWQPGQCVPPSFDQGPCTCFAGLCRGASQVTFCKITPGLLGGDSAGDGGSGKDGGGGGKDGGSGGAPPPATTPPPVSGCLKEGERCSASAPLIPQPSVQEGGGVGGGVGGEGSQGSRCCDGLTCKNLVCQKTSSSSASSTSSSSSSASSESSESSSSSDSSSSRFRLPNCGNGVLDPGEECGEQGLQCAPDEVCHPATCRCGACTDCNRCGEGITNLCDVVECMDLGPCFYRRRTGWVEGQCTAEAELCADIPTRCFACKECGGGLFNLCDRTECERQLGEGEYCEFVPRVLGLGLCKPKAEVCK